MAGSISQFKSSFSTDLARPNRFDVTVPIPLGLIPYFGITRQLNMRCEAAELPGRTLATTGMKIYGIEEKYPYMTAYNDLSLTFIVGDDMREKKFFDAWLNWINPSVTYDIKYKGDYTAIIRIKQYGVGGNETYQVDFMDAYPIAINPLQLDWSSDGYHKLTVTFAYTNWRNNSLEALSLEYLEYQIYSSIPPILPSNLGTDRVTDEMLQNQNPVTLQSVTQSTQFSNLSGINPPKSPGPSPVTIGAVPEQGVGPIPVTPDLLPGQ